jgi:hypothetical protein
MRSLWKVAACLGVITLAGPLIAQTASPEVTERAALRSLARTRIAEMVERRAVRPVEPARLAADAGDLAARLSVEQLRAIAEGEDVQSVIAPALRSISAAALGDATSDLLFVPLPPCRIIDTRNGGGLLQPGETRSFQVAGVTEFPPQGGNQGGCGVPPGSAQPAAAAVMINLVAIDALGKGNIAAWAYGEPAPLASSLNYSNIGMNIANGLIVPIAGTNLVPADLNIKASFAAVHVVADVTGYFTRFPIEQFSNNQKSITVITEGGQVDLSAGLCTQVSSCTIAAPAAGSVIVRAWTQVKINHGTNVGGDRIAVGVKNTDPTNCTNNDQSINASDFEVPDAMPADPDVDTTLSHKRIYTQSTGSKTYYINAKMITGGGAGDFIQNSRMICTFIPN